VDPGYQRLACATQAGKEETHARKQVTSKATGEFSWDRGRLAGFRKISGRAARGPRRRLPSYRFRASLFRSQSCTASRDADNAEAV